MNRQHKVVPVSGFKVLDAAQGIVEAIVSVTGVQDQVKDVIEPGAYAKTLKARTPKGAWAHDWAQPVSKTLSAVELMPGDRRLPAKTRNGDPWPAEAGGLLITTQFNLKTQRGAEAFADAEFFGDEQEWSIGYGVPIGGAKVDKSGVRTIKELDLFEYSQVLFGAMPLTSTVGVKDAQEAYRRLVEEAGTVPHEYRGERDLCDACGQPDGTKAHVAPVEAKDAIGSHSTGTSDATWSAADAEAGLGDSPTAATLRKEYAWVDPDGDDAAKSSYKFPHHFVSDGNPGDASTKACSSAIGSLNGARGGTKIPDGDRQGVYDHLAKHLTDAGMEAPDLKDAEGSDDEKDLYTDSPSGEPTAPRLGGGAVNPPKKPRRKKKGADEAEDEGAVLTLKSASGEDVEVRLPADVVAALRSAAPEAKVFADPTGSYEERQTALGRAVRAWMRTAEAATLLADDDDDEAPAFVDGWGGWLPYYACIEGTWDDRVVFCCYDWAGDDPPAFFQATYSFDGAEAELADVSSVAVSVTFAQVAADRVEAKGRWLVDRAADVRAELSEESKEGRTLSKATVGHIKGAMDSLIGLLDASGVEHGYGKGSTASEDDAEAKGAEKEPEDRDPADVDLPEDDGDADVDLPEGKALLTEEELLLAESLGCWIEGAA